MKTETIAHIQGKLDRAKESRDRIAAKIKTAIDAKEFGSIASCMEDFETARGEAEYYEIYLPHLESPSFLAHLIDNLTQPANDRYSGRGNDFVRAYDDGRKNALTVFINAVMRERGI